MAVKRMSILPLAPKRKRLAETTLLTWSQVSCQRERPLHRQNKWVKVRRAHDLPGWVEPESMVFLREAWNLVPAPTVIHCL